MNSTIGTRKKPMASSLLKNSLLKSSGASTITTSKNGSKTLRMENSTTSGWMIGTSTTGPANGTTTNAGLSGTPNGRTRKTRTTGTVTGSCPTAIGTTTSAGMSGKPHWWTTSEHHPLSDLHQLVSERPCTSSPPASATAMSSGRARTPQVLFAGSLAKFLILL